MAKNVYITFISVIGFIILAVLGYLSYNLYRVANKLPFTDGISGITNTISNMASVGSGVIRPTDPIHQFEIKGSSAEYDVLWKTFIDLNFKILNNSSKSLYPEYEAFYKKAIPFAMDENNDKKERAYMFNIINLFYVQGFDHDSLYNALKNDSSLLAEYNSNLNDLKKYKKLKTTMSGAMFDTGSVEKNYAIQKTMEHMDAISYELYPNSYAALRGALNYNQANLLLYSNYDLGMKFSSYDDFVRSKFYTGYIENYGPKIEKVRKEGNFYTDLAGSSYEADITYSEFLIIKYRRLSDTQVEERKAILKEVIVWSDEMVAMSNRYNSNNQIFYGFFLAAVNKVRVVNFGLLSAEENAELMTDAVKIMEELIKNDGGQQMSFWVKNMPASGTPYKAFVQMGEKSKVISDYIKSVRG